MTHLSTHCGMGGNHNGLGVFLDQLVAAGFKVWLKSVDSYGPLIDATRRGGTGVFRLSTAGQGDGFDYDVPNYHGDPAAVATTHWAATRAKLPPEFDKANVWLEVINEVDKNQAEFLGAFALYIARLANADGVKVLMFSFSSGEPEPEFWEEPNVLEYLRYCEENPSMAGVALHEYNYGHRPYAEVYPHHVGRFQWLYDACDRHGITRPRVAITEWGFSQDGVPTWEEGGAYARDCFGLYSRYAIDGAALWCLQAWHANVPNQANAFMKSMGPWMASVGPQSGDRNTPLDPVYFEPQQQQTLEQAIWEFGIANQTIDTNADAAIEKAIGRDGLFQIGDEKWMRHEGESYATQPAYDAATGEKRVYYARVPDWGNVQWTGEPGPTEPPIDPPPVTDPLRGITLGPLFHVPHVITSPFNAVRDYGLHEGIDIDIIGGPPNSQEPVRCAYDGVVERVATATGAYYNYVIVRHVAGAEAAEPGTVFKTWYAHNDALYVKVGQVVSRGEPLAELGGTGGNWGEHSHLNLQLPGRGLPGYVVADVIDPGPYYTTAIPVTKIDLLPYFLPRSGDAWMLQASWGPQEKTRVEHDAGTRTFRHIKNTNWERLHYDASTIYRSIDTSPGPDASGKDRYYSIADGTLPYSKWLMRYGKPGDWFERSPVVRFFYKDGCVPITAYTDHSWLNVVAIHKEYQFKLTGMVVRDVLELAWSQTRGGAPIERYWYAGGLVGWMNVSNGAHSAIASYTVGDNQPEVIPCL